MMATTLKDLLDRLERDASAVSAEAEEMAAALSPAQLAWKPNEGAWSIAQCLDHLHRTNEPYFAALRAALDAAAPGAADGEYRPGMFARWFIRQVGPRGGARMKAPRSFRPAQTPAPAGTAGTFAAGQATLLGLIRDARRHDPQRVRITSPLTRLLRFSAAEALELVVGHEQRHLAQARRVRGHPEFPAR